MPPREISIDWSSIAQQTFSRIGCGNYKFINAHNFIPNKYNFNKVDNEEDLFLGVELEVDAGGMKDDNAKKVIDTLGENNVYCKSDGSLQNGFEIVSHPCTYEYHKNMPYELLFEELTKLGYKSHDIGTCGLHVHFNRDYFGKEKLTQDLNISKLLYLYEKFWEKVVLIARRGSCHYAQRFYLNDNDTIFDMYAKSKNSNKYGIINLQHKDTVEIRIFKGTLNYRTFMVTLEFVKIMAQIVRDIDIYDIQYITWDKVLEQLSNELIDYINEREKIKEEIKTKEQNSRGLQSNNIYTSSPIAYDSIASFSNEYSVDWSVDWSDSARFTVTPETMFASRPMTTMAIQSHTTRDIQNCYNTIEPFSIENMTVEQLKRKIKELERMVRRSRNPMEQTNLRREIQKYSNRIGELRGRRELSNSRSRL